MNTKRGQSFRRCTIRALCLLAVSVSVASALGQNRGLTLFGDVKVDESRAEGKKLGSLTIVLYTQGGANVVGRQNVPVNGRYRFNNVSAAEYEIGIEVETTEIARVHVSVSGTPGSDYRQDLEFEWKPLGKSTTPKAGTISAADAYSRSPANESVFAKAQQAVDRKKYEVAVLLFKQVVDNDSQDYLAWTELGTSYLLLEKQSEAEKCYEKASEVRPTFFLAFLNLGRVRMAEKKYDAAVSSLSRAVDLDSSSAEANLLLGESYLQVKKGSKAVNYLNEAARLGKPEAHLRLAALYDAVGMKDKATAEYEQFLKKKPDYPDRKKLEKYITENKKQP